MNEEQVQKMQEQIKALTEQNALFMQMFGNSAMSKNKADIDDTILFESLSLSPLYLSTEGNGRGDVYFFENFGDTQNIPLVDAREIVRHNKSFVQSGLVYIKDDDFVTKENLQRYYNKLLDATGINNLLLCKRQEFGNRFSKLSKLQQETVCGMLFDKLKNNKKVDEEVLFYIQNYFGKNLKEEVTNFQKMIDEDKED